MQEEWPDYLYEAGERAVSTSQTDRAERWNELCLSAALEHLSRRREQVDTLRRRAAALTALALVEGGVLLGLLLYYLIG